MDANSGFTQIHLPETGFIRQHQLIPNIVPVSAPTLWRWIKIGAFPAPHRLGPRAVGWKVEAVRTWLDSRKAA